METLYLICLLVGGFFVLLSLFGGGESDADGEVDVDTDFDADSDGDFDEAGDMNAGATGPGLVDLFSVRALFLFAAFFGLTGVALSLVGTGEPFTA